MSSNKRFKQGALASILVLPIAVTATPLFDTFGPLPEADFGGSGIPNTEVAYSTQLEDGDTTITVGLSASQRYGNPVVTSDGAGTFFAQAGSSVEGPSNINGALWNFNYYIDIDGPAPLSDYDITIFYDFNPAFDNGPAGLGKIDFSIPLGPFSTIQDSQNLLFNFLAIDGTPLPGITITAPTDVAVFDPNAIGEYNFAIQVSRAGWGVEAVRIDVQTVPVPAAVWLFGSGLLGLIAVARRKQRSI